jgi:uncharacterized damage-inducible protein DinB
MTDNPYGKYVEGEDVVASLDTTARRIADVVGRWPAAAFERSYAEGKWTGRQLLIHLAQAEMVFANRLRFALAQDDYVVQPFDQDPWMTAEEAGDGASALAAYLALRKMNLDLCRRLTPLQRLRTFRHPERGEIDVNWVMTMFAGHERHHLPQLEAIKTSA